MMNPSHRIHLLQAVARQKIGVHAIGSNAPPPALALARRGIIDNVVGYSLYGDYRQPNPPARLIDAVADGDIDVAVAWGPLAGYFAQHEKVPLGEAAAQGERPSPNRQPSPEQLLQTPVGGTHIPQKEQPARLQNPYEDNSNAVAQGHKLFHSMHCIGCHAAQGGGGIGPPLSDNSWIYGGEPAQIYLSILQGRPNGMPSFARAMPSDDIWKLVTYVQTLSQSPKDTVGMPPKTMQTGQP